MTMVKLILDVELTEDCSNPDAVAEGMWEALMQALDILPDIPGLSSVHGWDLR